MLNKQNVCIIYALSCYLNPKSFFKVISILLKLKISELCVAGMEIPSGLCMTSLSNFDTFRYNI